MKKDEIGKEVTIIQKSVSFDNPILRHFIKKHKLNDKDSLVLGTLLDLTNQMRTEIKTHYNVISEYSELSSMDVYQSVNSLHRFRIIDYKPEGNFVHISFNKIDEKIEEIALAYINAEKIRRLEEDVSYMKRMNYVPSKELFDMLTPIIGKLIAKKISEALRALINYINDRLESNLSARMWRYRFISFRTGIPLGEVILKESLPCVVDEILIIEKKTSLLIGEASRHDEEDTDRDVVVSMLAAIMDFIHTSFKNGRKKNDEGTTLKEIQFGESRILIQESSYFYAAFVVTGSPNIDFITAADSLVDDLHADYRNKLRKFNGSMYGLEGINPALSDFINKMNAVKIPGYSEERSFRKLKITAAVLLIFLAVWTVWTVISEISDYRLEKKIEQAVSEKLPKFSYDLEFDADGDELEVKGLVSSPAIAGELEKAAGGFPEIKSFINKTVVTDFRTAEKFRKEMDDFERRFSDLQLLMIKQELEKIVIQFPSGVDVMGNNQMLQARKIYEIIRDYPQIDMDVIAFNDPEGGFEVNKKLAEGRMKAVSDYIVSLGINAERIHLTEFNPDVISADPRYAEFRDRRGIMLFARKKN